MAATDSAMQNVRVVDLRSDTFSTPTEEMRRAMYEAEVGDDCMREDPTVNALEEKAAKMFGKQAALFVLSGTASNLIATLAHCDRRGCDIIVGDRTHMLLLEQSGVAQLGGVQMTAVRNLPDGTFDLDELRSKIHDNSISSISETGMICVENTHNFCSGLALPLPWLQQLVELAREIKIPLHMDGARVFNAALKSGVTVAELCKGFDSVSVCVSKGLGAPVGSLLLGDLPFINKARRIRRALGGGWRQAGVLAAAGIYALDHMVDRLADDHARTRTIAEAIVGTNTQLISIDLEKVQTNIFFMKFSPQLSNQQFLQRLQTVTADEEKHLGKEGVCVVKAFCEQGNMMRMVLYHNVSEQDVTAAVKKLQFVIKEFENKK